MERAGPPDRASGGLGTGRPTCHAKAHSRRGWAIHETATSEFSESRFRSASRPRWMSVLTLPREIFNRAAISS